MLNTKAQHEIFNAKNLFEVILNTEERVLILTYWRPEYPGSSIEGYEYQAVKYDINGDFICKTETFHFNDERKEKMKLKKTSKAKETAIKLLNDLLLWVLLLQDS